MTDIELKSILDLHNKWLKDIDGGKCADLEGANLRGADLRGTDLRGANLLDANLLDANLRDANLVGANIKRANYVKIIGSRHELQHCKGIVFIGYIKHTIDEWLDQYEQIGKDNNYTEKEIKEYGIYLKMIKDNFSEVEK